MSSKFQFLLRPETEEDKSAVLALIPRLADIELPSYRVSEHVWKDVVVLYLDWCEKRDHSLWVCVAESDGQVVGVTMVQPREEILSREPSAHLSILSVAKAAEGHGVGETLLDAAEEKARENGAKSLSLFVFAKNTRARAVYERAGFTGELVRYYKPLEKLANSLLHLKLWEFRFDLAVTRSSVTNCQAEFSLQAVPSRLFDRRWVFTLATYFTR